MTAIDRVVALALTWALPGSSALALTPPAFALVAPAASTARMTPSVPPVIDEAEGVTASTIEPLSVAEPAPAAVSREDDEDDALRPILECVVRNSASSYTAYFGFKNETNQTLSIPVGGNNGFSPGAQNRNQPTTFPKGRSPVYPNAAFAVPFNGSNLTWTLRGPDRQARTVTANSSSPRCQVIPTPTPTPTATPLPSPTPPLTCASPVLSARRFTRTSDDNGPTVYNQTFALPAGSNGPYTLRAVNGDTQGRNKTTSAEVKVNGVEVVGESDFSNTVVTFTKTVQSLLATNQLYVRVKGAPGSTFTLEICGAAPGDTVPPSVDWLSPLEGEVLRDATPLFRVRYSDLVSAPNLSTLKILLDGVDQTASYNKQPDEASFDSTTPLVDGAHSLRAEIKDQAGNLGVGTRSFRIDATSPTISIPSPANGAVTNVARPQIRLSFADAGVLPSGIDTASLAVSLDGVDITASLAVTSTGATGLPPASLSSGSHRIDASIKDRAGNAGAAVALFNVDTIPPVITALLPSQGQVLGVAAVPIVVQYSDDQELNLASFTATIDGALLTLLVDADSASGTTAQLADGPHTLTFSIADRAGNVRSTATSFSTDTGKPEIGIVPAGGQLVNSRNPEIVVSFSDAQGIAPGTLRIRVNGVDRTGEFAVGAGVVRATLGGPLPEGPNTVAAEVRDNAQNLGTAAVTFTVDVTAPAITIQSPQANGFLNDPTPDVRVALSDGLTGITTDVTRIFVDGSDATADFALGPDGATGTLSTPLAEGPHTLEVLAADRAGNPATSQVQFHIDLTAPTLDMASPRADGFTNDPTPEIWLRTSDLPGALGAAAAGVDAASIRVFLLSEDPLLPDTDITAMLTVGAADTRGELLTPLADGSHRLKAVARDLAGNESSVTVGFVVDTVAPTLTIDQPQSNTFLGSAEPTIVLLYGDERSGIAPDLVQVKVDGIDRSSALVRTATGASLTLSRSLGLDLADGPHQVEARVIDRAGNATDAAPVSFGVDTSAPVVAVQAPMPQSFTGSPTPAIQFTLTDAAPSSGLNPVFAKVLIDGVDITSSMTFTSTGGGINTVVVAGVGAVSTPLLDGLHTLRITAIDNANNPAEINVQFTVDNGAPVITSDVPEEGRLIGGSALTNGRATVTGTVFDLDPNPTVTCSSGAGAGVVTLAANAYTCVVAVTDGVNTIVVAAADSTGHTSTLSRPLTLDRTPPVVSVTAPTEGTFTAATSLSVTGTVTDQSAVVVTVNGAPATVNGGTGGGPSTFEARGVAVGAGPNVALDVVATDAAGNTSTARVTVRVDRNAPIVSITSPSSGAYLRGGVTTVTAEVTDETTTILDLNGIPGVRGSCAPAAAGTQRCSFTAEVPLLAGNASIIATAFDEAGNRGVAQVSATVDNTPPAITVSSPAVGLITNATSISVAGTATDASPLTLTINGQSVATDASGSFSATITSDILGRAFAGIEGAASLVFTATDAAGNTSSTTVPITFDRTPPSLSIASPLSGVVVPTSSLSVSGTVSDATTVSVFVQGVPALVTGQAYSHTLTDLSEGPLTVTVRAVDAAGNETTLTRDVEIDLGPPTLAITAPAAGALVREAFVTLAYTVADRSRTTVTINGTPAQDCPGVVPCDRTQQVTLVDGDNTFTIEATDAGGRATTARVTVTRDSVLPTLDLQTPATVSRGRAATASASATDNLAVEHVEIRLGSTVLCSASTSCSAPIVIPEGFNPGDSLTITAEATDRAGNTTTTSRTVRVTTDGVVTGTVLNDLTSLPVAGATVTLLSGNPRSAATDANGRFNIPVADAFATLRITKAGMTSVDRVVSVASGSGTVPIDARLTPLAAITTQSPVIPAANPPAIIPAVSPNDVQGVPGPVSVVVPAGSQRVTLLSQQGLPNLLPPGFSPVAAFLWTSDAPGGTATATFAMPIGTATVPESMLVRYDPGMRDWRIVITGLAATDGIITTDIPGPGSYALIVPDSTTPAMTIGAPGEALAGLPVVNISPTATSESRVDPAVLPPTGGTATGSMRLDSPSALPSGTIVQAEVEEFYTLTSGEEASAAKRSIDVVTFKRKALGTSWGTGANAGTIAGTTVSTICAPETPVTPVAGTPEAEHLCASFPITPSRTYGNAALKEGRVHLDLLAGRENARGTVGGNAATTITDGTVQLNVAAGSLDEDTAIAFFAYDTFSSFLPSTNGITPLGEVTVDLGSSTLNTPASLTFHNVAAAPGDTLVVARVDRAEFDGIPRLQVVALADVVTANGETSAVSRVDTGLPGLALDGIKAEGRYVLLRLAGPVGWLKGLTTAGGSPVRALVSTNTLPFFATSSGSGAFAIPSAPGAVTLTARVLGQSLVGSASAVAIDGVPVTADIALQGTVSQATVVPVSGSLGVEVNEPLTLTSPVALNPNTVIPANISLRRVPPQRCAEPDPPASLNCAATQIPLRLVLSGSGKQLSIVPTAPVTIPATPALEFSTDYRLEVTGLLDTVGGLVTAPTINFRTKDDVKPVYNLKALTFSFPDADGLVTVSAPNGTLPPGTEILIINSGNGVVLGLTAGNDGQVNGALPASTLDTLIVSVTDPFGNTVIYRQSQYVDPATGETAIGPGGGSIEGAGGVGLDVPEGALTDGGGEWKAKISLVPETEYPALYPRDVLSKLLDTDLHAGHTLKIEANREATFSHEVDVRFPLPDFTTAPADQRPSKPQDAFYTVHRRLLVCPDGANTCAEASKIVVFDVIDEAKAQCKAVPSSTSPKAVPATCEPEDMEIVTASPPFVGLVGMAVTTILLMSWAMPLLAADLGRPTRGLIRGKVSRQAYQTGKLTTVPVVGAVVSGVSPDDVDPVTGEKKPLAYIEGGTRVTTDAAGAYAFWDKRYAGGPIEVVASSRGASARGTGFEVLPGEPNTPRYTQEAVVNITFPTEAPPPPTPDIVVKLVRADNNSIDLRGIAAIGVPLQVGIKGSIPGQAVTINGVEINGVNYSTRTDLTGRYDYILDSPFEPTIPGAYRLSGTALRPLGDPVSFGETFRIVAAGGGVDTDNANPPRVIEARTAPKKNAKGVSVGTFVSLSFTEPVKNVLGNIEFTSPEGVVPFKISAVTADQTVIEDLATAPTAAVTSITLQPLQGLKFATRYTVRATSGIEDLDKDATNQPAPKSLPTYETSFETFGPETINPDSQDTYSTGGFVILKTDESTTGWALKHAFGTSTWNGVMLGYDASDPANLTQLSSTLISNRVIDITGEGTTVVVASGPNHRSHPGDLLVYDVTNPQAPQWVGATTLSTGALDGTPSRIKLRNEKVYAATWGKGIQIADLLQMKSGFAECCSTAYFSMVDALYRDGGSFNTGAVTTINVIDPNSSAKPWMRDISVIDVNGETIIAVASSIGLVLANEGQQRVTYTGFPSFGGRAITYAYAVETALIAGRSIVLVAGIDATGQNILVVVDISEPLNPTPIASMALATQGKAVADIEINDGKAYIGFDSPTAPQIEIVQIGDPAQPSSAGVVAGVGGRLQIVDGILYGASYGYATDGVLGGIRTAALQRVLILQNKTATIPVSEGGVTGIAAELTYRVVPAEPGANVIKVEVLRESTPVTDITGAFDGSKGFTTWPAGISVQPARYFAQAITDEGTEDELRSLRVPLPVSTVTVELNNEYGVLAAKTISGQTVIENTWDKAGTNLEPPLNGWKYENSSRTFSKAVMVLSGRPPILPNDYVELTLGGSGVLVWTEVGGKKIKLDVPNDTGRVEATLKATRDLAALTVERIPITAEYFAEPGAPPMKLKTDFINVVNERLHGRIYDIAAAAVGQGEGDVQGVATELTVGMIPVVGDGAGIVGEAINAFNPAKDVDKLNLSLSLLGIATEFTQITGPAGVILDKGVTFIRVGMRQIRAAGATAAVLVAMPTRLLSHVKLRQWDELAELAQGTFKLSMIGGGKLAKNVLRSEEDIQAVNRFMRTYGGDLLDSRLTERLRVLDDVLADPDAVRGAIRALADVKDTTGALIRLSDDAVAGAVKFVARAGDDLPPEAREALLRRIVGGSLDDAEGLLKYLGSSTEPTASLGIRKLLRVEATVCSIVP